MGIDDLACFYVSNLQDDTSLALPHNLQIRASLTRKHIFISVSRIYEHPKPRQACKDMEIKRPTFKDFEAEEDYGSKVIS